MFDLYNTHGVSLDVVISQLWGRNMIPDWLDFFDQATKVGKMKPEKVFTLLTAVLEDVYDPPFRQEVLRRLRLLRPG